MKTQKIVIHGINTEIALKAILEYIEGIPHFRNEQHGTKVRLFGPAGGAPVVEYRAANSTTCLCTECVTRRKTEAALVKAGLIQRSRQQHGRLFKPSMRKVRAA